MSLSVVIAGITHRSMPRSMRSSPETRRFKGLPNTPTFAESGVAGVDATLIVGFMAPARTPAAIVELLHDTLAGVLAQADIVERLGEQALDVVASDPARSSDILRVEQALWTRVVKSSGATAE